MPKLNTANPEVETYLLDVVEFWTRTGIDGWRLDVANEIDLGFWRNFRKRVKSINPDALIIGEMWNDSLPYLAGDMVDSVMNYPFSMACREFFLTGELDAAGFRNLISERMAAYPYPMVYAMYNLFGSHDTARWLTLAKGDAQKVALSMVFQFTFVGMPAIYYGDETAMEGDNPIQARRCMNFSPEKNGQDFLALYQKLAALRTRSRALCEGDFSWIETNSALIAFKREYREDLFPAAEKSGGDKQTFIVINNTKETVSIDGVIPPDAEPVLSSGAGGKCVEPMGYRVYRQ
jgi:glycosidase